MADTKTPLHVGNLPTLNQDEYPCLGRWWVQLWDGDNVVARAYGDTPQAARAMAERLAAQAQAEPVAPIVSYVPIRVDPHAEDGGRHPNDKEPRSAAMQKALDLRGDSEGQGLSTYWKWGFASGWNAHTPDTAAPQPHPSAAVASDMAELADNLERYNQWRRGGDGPQPEPADIGRWIEQAVATLRTRADQQAAAPAQPAGQPQRPKFGCGRALAAGQWWTLCGQTDMGQTPPALCTDCGGEFKLASEKGGAA